MEEAPRVVTLSELLERSVPLSGASSLNPSSSSSSSVTAHIKPIYRVPSTDSASVSVPSDRSRSPRILASLNHPTVLLGTLNLHADGKCFISNSMSCACFSFSDDESRVCCDILDFDLKLIGKRVYVLSWNFIPFKCGNGFLEIIRWSLFDSTCKIGRCPNFLGDYQVESEGRHFKARSRVIGRLESVSPVSVVPCTVQNHKDRVSSIQNSTGSRNLSGFLAELMVCQCELCSSEASLVTLNDSCRDMNLHSFKVAIMVLFLGRASSWHTVLSRLLGNTVCITGLKKKMVFIGEEDSYSMLVTTEKAALHASVFIPQGLSIERTAIKGSGELCSYTGTVTGVYMQGMVVELDDKVWLLLTDHLLAPPHALRIGALISIRNVHFAHPKFSWTRMLLLGAGFKTSISVRSFSPLESQFHVRSYKQSLLSKFLDSLVCPARFWVLLTISCFKKKFAGIFSEKRVLGSKHNEGLVQMYAKSCLPSCVFQQRHGVFMEFCKHNLRGCGCEPNCNHLKLVVPLSNFISHCEAIWGNLLVQMQNDSQRVVMNGLHSCGGVSYCRLIRHIISSEELGFFLMGTLQISPSSGRLQLIDASGSIDCVVPDMPSNCDESILYEVRCYSVVIEGLPTKVGVSNLLKRDEALSCRSIFQHSLPESNVKPSAIYVHFYLRDAAPLNVHLHLSSMDWSDNLIRVKSGRFHLLMVTHKFSAIQNFLGDPLTVNKSSLFAEAIRLPWDLYLPGGQSDPEGTGVSDEEARKYLEHGHGRNYLENLCNKRPKLACGSSANLITVLKDNLGVADDRSCGSLSNCSSPCKICSSNHNSNNFTLPHEIPCSVAIRIFNDQSPARQGILLRADCDIINDEVRKSIGWRTILEFKPETYSNYQLLKVGGYYIMNDWEVDFYNLDDHDHASFGKTLVTSQTQLWSLSFSCDEVQSISGILENRLWIASMRNDDVPSRSSPNNELFFRRCPSQSPEIFSDINLHISADAMKFLNVDLEILDGMKPIAISGHNTNASTCIGNVMSSGTPYPDCRLPQGNLISFCGNVVDVHNFSCYSVDISSHVTHDNIGDVHYSRLFQGVFSSVCIHISEDRHIFRLRGTLLKNSYPIGMGSGVHATFHRVLVIGQHELMLTPVSLVVINNIKEVCRDSSHWCSCPHYGSNILNDEFLDVTSSRLFSELVQHFENKPVQFCCRVVAIHILVLEKKKKNFERPQAKKQSQVHADDIPLASFILDDGSSPCCCWASSEIAEILLGLHKVGPAKGFHKNNWSLKTGRASNTDRRFGYYLHNILKKHEKISVKNQGSMFDSANQDLTFSVKSDNVFSSSDEDHLKLMILNACSGTILSIKGNLMDSNAIQQLGELMEIDLSIKGMCNIWAVDVRHANPQMEARNLIEELTR